jgi:hypothetical protein
MIAYNFNPSNREEEAGKLQVWGQPRLHSKFKSSLTGRERTCLKSQVCSSVVNHLPHIHKALSLIPSAAKKSQEYTLLPTSALYPSLGDEHSGGKKKLNILPKQMVPRSSTSQRFPLAGELERQLRIKDQDWEKSEEKTWETGAAPWEGLRWGQGFKGQEPEIDTAQSQGSGQALPTCRKIAESEHSDYTEAWQVSYEQRTWWPRNGQSSKAPWKGRWGSSTDERHTGHNCHTPVFH